MSALSSTSIDAVRFLTFGGLHRWLGYAVQHGDAATAERIEAELARRAAAGLFAAERKLCRYCPCRNTKQQHEADHGRGVCKQCWKALQREIRTGRATEGELIGCGLLESSDQ